MHGVDVQDNANRTIKQVEYTITADGYVTLPKQPQITSIAPAMATLARLLQAQAGPLVYRGRGFDLVVNVPNVVGHDITFITSDVAWGPVPKLIEFQPLGGGLSAKVKWQVVTRLAVDTANPHSTGNLLQLNYETSLHYGEDCFSSLAVRGTMEIPMTRAPSQRTRTLTTTVDDFRRRVEDRIISGIDQSRFRLTGRDFNVSRDKRTLEFDVTADEKPYMDNPPDCTVARGSYNVRPAKTGMGLVQWHCTMQNTYVVRADRGRRIAWAAFLSLLKKRMDQAGLGNIPPPNANQNPEAPIGGNINVPEIGLGQIAFIALGGAGGPGGANAAADIVARNMLAQVQAQIAARNQNQNQRRAFLIDFSFNEGLYQDSKTVSFSATWKLITTFSHILLASGLWKKVPETDAQGNNVWALSMRDVSGSQSWLVNRLDPAADVIVDFGGPA